MTMTQVPRSPRRAGKEGYRPEPDDSCIPLASHGEFQALEQTSDVTEISWFGGNEDTDFLDGQRFYADGSIRFPTEEEIASERKRMRRYYAVQNQFRKQGSDGHEWRDREGWSMVIRRQSRVIAVQPFKGEYRDGFQAVIAHPERARNSKLTRDIRTRLVPYRGQAIADGLELMTTHRLARRQRIAKSARDRMIAEHDFAAKYLFELFREIYNPEAAKAANEAWLRKAFR